ncbi:MAG: hypothetical protein NC131_12365 [Roseburia sp.]|nr:hypothetical protein [Roseburia sp.]
MRYITEATAKIIEERLEQYIADLKAVKSTSLRQANKLRLTQIALKELKTNKTIKNGKINRKQS